MKKKTVKIKPHHNLPFDLAMLIGFLLVIFYGSYRAIEGVKLHERKRVAYKDLVDNKIGLENLDAEIKRLKVWKDTLMDEYRFVQLMRLGGR